MGEFRFKHFTIQNDRAALKVGTDAVLLGAAMSLNCKDGARLLDVGTGTGVIALMAAQRCQSAQIEAIDIDGPSIEEATENFARSPWAERLHAVCIALQDYHPETIFDHIFSNPPFYDNSLINPDSREAAARHTGELSYRDILAFASAHLAADGKLSLILPADLNRELTRCAASFSLMPFRILEVRTTASKPPRRIIAEFSRPQTRQHTVREELILQNGAERTKQYKELTKDFYL